ncbi:MAG: 30S ribosomal protein S12 methylthiotransferase RimO [Thermoleophilia bacterium]
MRGVYILTLGCPKNEADSHTLAARLRASGVEVLQDPEQASHVLVNTCGFIEDAREESIDAVLSVAQDFPEAEILVMGCLVERYREQLAAELPEVDGWYGLGDLSDLHDHLVRGAGRPMPGARRASAASFVGAPAAGFAYIKISDGCDHRCSFCAIPQIKGPYYPVPPEEILENVRGELETGVRELVLVGQDTAIWRWGDVDLLGLVHLVAQDERVARVRLMYLQPEHVTDRLLESMAAHGKLCRYLDIPLQHASPRLLKGMGRAGDAESYLALLDKARRLMPDVSLRSTFIVGFPGETDEDVDALLGFLAEARFEHAGVFAYSVEEGTRAALLPHRLPAEVVRERLTVVTSAISDIAERVVADRVGGVVDVIVDRLDDEDGPEGTYAVARTCGQAPDVDGVTFLAGSRPPDLQVGDTISVLLTESIGYDLVATPVGVTNG